MTNLKDFRLANLHEKTNEAVNVAEKKAAKLLKVEEKKLKIRKQK